MKALIAALSLLAATPAHASNFYECEGFAGVDEYRVGITLSEQKAGFFDNDATSIMTLKSVKSLESNPPQALYTFEGPEASYDGTLRLQFNQTRLHAVLISIDRNGKEELLGEAPCKAEKTGWDLSEEN